MSGDDQTRRGKNRVSTIGAARQIIRQHGVTRLWKGFNLHLARDVIGGGVYFGVYESCKQALGSYYGDEMKNTPWAIPLAGAICGISSWVVVSLLYHSSSTLQTFVNNSIQTYPIDTMKTRAQNQLLTGQAPVPTPALSDHLTDEAAKAAKKAAKQASRQGRWRGIEMVIVRTAIQNMIQMTAFEQVKVLIDNAKFKNGSKTLPHINREKGRDRKVG